MTAPNPLIHVGEGRTATTCTPLSVNLDVRIKNVDPTNPTLLEKKKYFVQCTLRNDGTIPALACYVQLWWSPANITGTSMQMCTGSVFGPPVNAQSSPFTVNGKTSKVLPDLVWNVPDMSAVAPSAQGAFKLILKAFYPGFNTSPPLQPNPSVSPECDPRCGVRCITIVGA
jgi:hypothetical protein